MRPPILLASIVYLTALTTAAAGLFAACSGSNNDAARQEQSDAPVSATCVRGPTPTPYPPQLKGTPLPPDLRPDSTRMAEIDQGRQRRFDGISTIIASGCDPRSLPMAAVTHNDGGYPQTFDEALRTADLVATAHVTKTTFTIEQADHEMPHAEALLAIDHKLKGDAPKTIAVYQSGGPMPDYGGIVGYVEGDPILLRGDYILLLARKRTSASGYWTVYPMGTYYIENGVIRAGGSRCSWATGRSIDDMSDLIRRSLHRKASDDPLIAPLCNGSGAQ